MADPTTRDRILDAAEDRVRKGGYNGFSFRDLAEDVGIKSASIHHHFPTKEELVATLSARYTDKVLARIAELPAGRARIDGYRRLLRGALTDQLMMCMCGLLGAESAALPKPVTVETRRFFDMLISDLTAALAGETDHPRRAARALVAQFEGAMLLARAYEDVTYYDDATERLEALL